MLIQNDCGHVVCVWGEVGVGATTTVPKLNIVTHLSSPANGGWNQEEPTPTMSHDSHKMEVEVLLYRFSQPSAEVSVSVLSVYWKYVDRC